MASPRLTNEKDIILALHAQGYSQAEIIRHVREEYGREIKRSTLSDFLKSQPKPGRAAFDEDEELERALPPLAGRTEGQAAEPSTALATFYKATADEMIDKLVQVVEGLQQVKQEGDTHYKALSGKIDTLGKRLRGEVPRSTLRRIWVRTFVAWGLLFVAVFVWQPTFIATTVLSMGHQGHTASVWLRGQGEALWSTVAEWVWGQPAVPVKPARKAVR